MPRTRVHKYSLCKPFLTITKSVQQFANRFTTTSKADEYGKSDEESQSPKERPRNSKQKILYLKMNIREAEKRLGVRLDEVKVVLLIGFW